MPLTTAGDEHVRFIKQEIDQARRRGVECIGIGIQSSAVKEIYPNNVVVNNVGDLSRAAFSKLSRALLDGKNIK